MRILKGIQQFLLDMSNVPAAWAKDERFKRIAEEYEKVLRVKPGPESQKKSLDSMDIYMNSGIVLNSSNRP